MRDTFDALLVDANEHLSARRFQHAKRVLAMAHAATSRQPRRDAGMECLAAQIAALYVEVPRETNHLRQAFDLATGLAADLTGKYGTADPITAQTVAVLGAICHDTGRLSHSERCYHHVLTGCAAPHGPAGRAMRRAANLALLHHDRGRPQQALRELNAAHAQLHRYQGGANVDALHVAADLAALLHQHGHTLQAHHLLTRSLHEAAAGLAADHPLIALLATDLGAVAAPDNPPRPHNPRAPPSPDTRYPDDPRNVAHESAIDQAGGEEHCHRGRHLSSRSLRYDTTSVRNFARGGSFAVSRWPDWVNWYTIPVIYSERSRRRSAGRVKT